MKLKKMLACVAMAVAVSLCSTVNTSATYHENEGSLSGDAEIRSTYLSFKSSSLTISGKTAICESEARGNLTVTQISGDMYLDKYTSGEWEPVDAWRLQQMGNEFSLTKTKSNLSSGLYRVRTEFTVTTSGGGTEIVTDYSAPKTVS